MSLELWGRWPVVNWVEEIIVTIAFFESADSVAAKIVSDLFEGRTYQIDKRWSFRVDAAHTVGMQQHNHILFKGREISVINRDGSPSHNTSREAIPRHILDHLTTNKFIVENSQHVPGVPLVPSEVVEAAITKARARTLLLTIQRVLRETHNKFRAQTERH